LDVQVFRDVCRRVADPVQSLVGSFDFLAVMEADFEEVGQVVRLTITLPSAHGGGHHPAETKTRAVALLFRVAAGVQQERTRVSGDAANAVQETFNSRHISLLHNRLHDFARTACERRLKTLALGRLKRLAPDVVLLLVNCFLRPGFLEAEGPGKVGVQ
jgi:hypothetical protein